MPPPVHPPNSPIGAKTPRANHPRAGQGRRVERALQLSDRRRPGTGRRGWLGAAAGLVAVLAGMLLLATSVFAGATGVLEIGHFEPALRSISPPEPSLFSTRVELSADINRNEGNVSKPGTKWRIEYATSEKLLDEGEGTLAASGECPTATPECGAFPEIHHLIPATLYFARVVAENAHGQATKTIEFKTLRVAPPEVIELRGRQVESDTSVGINYVAVEGDLESNGAETQYVVEYATSEAGPWKAAAGTGTSGTVTVAEDFVEAAAQITGLSPETTYYVRVTAKNAKGKAGPAINQFGEAQPPLRFTTNPPHPFVNISTATNVTEGSALLHGTVVPHSSETQWHFEYAAGEAGPWSPAPGAEGVIAAGEADEKIHFVSGELAGLSPGTTYFFRVSAKNAFGAGTVDGGTGIGSFGTLGPPTATAYEVHAIHGEAIRPLGFVDPHGRPTHYHFEYVSQAQFEAGGWAGASGLPEAEGGQIVGQDLPGLAPGVYHVRLAASNESEKGETRLVHSSEQSVTVPAPGPAGEPSCPNQALRGGASAKLADCRAFELLTPADKEGAQDIFHYGTVKNSEALVGEDGEHVMFVNTPTKWGASADPSSSNYLFSRTAGGWRMTSATPEPQAAQNRYSPQLFNSDLTQLGLEVGWQTTPNVASPNVEFKLGPTGGPYTEAVTVPRSSNSQWAGASADSSNLILRSEDRTLLGHPTATTSGYDLYEYAGGQPRQVNVLTGGAAISACGAKMAKGAEGFPPFLDQESSPHAVSADGSRVFFQTVPGSNCSAPPHLYMRVGGGETVDVGEYTFLAADTVGSKLLLEHDNSGTHELFLYDTGSATAKHLFSTHEPVGGQAIVSENLTALYFTSKERLIPGAPPVSEGSEDVGVNPKNLYRYDILTETLLFVAQTGDQEWGGTASVSPDGRYYYWPSGGVAGVPGGGGGKAAHPVELYRYDSVENVVQCTSCASPFDPRPKLAASFLPGQEAGAPGNSGMPSPSVSSANGDYVFFDTVAALVPQDVNGEIEPEGILGEHPSSYFSLSSDVYEWRKNGVDGCPHVQGCVSLISSGAGGYKVELIGTTPSGHDVFFATHESLLAQDTDTSGDIYDARIGGGYPPAPPRPVECEGAACSTPQTPPNDTTPSSFTFAGAGNLVQPPPIAGGAPKTATNPRKCAKGKALSHHKCVKRKTKGKKRNPRAHKGGKR